MRSGGSGNAPRAMLPTIPPAVSSSTAPNAAPASAAIGAHRELEPLVRSCGARRAPMNAPPMIPATESALAMSPFLSPSTAVTPTKPSANQSTVVTGFTLAAGSEPPGYNGRRAAGA
jgi:hypothetical protein